MAQKLFILCFVIFGVLNAKPIEEDHCRDGVDNLVRAKSDLSEKKPAVIKSFSGALYRLDGSPACNSKRPTVLLPGYVKLIAGELHVPKKYDLVKSGVMKLTIKGNSFDDPLCLNGESQYLALPNSFCRVNLCKFIGNDICEILQEPGVHSIKELEEKLNFNSTLELPEPPSLLGISLLDLFSGDFSFDFTIESEGNNVLDMRVPVNEKFLQIGVDNNDN